MNDLKKKQMIIRFGDSTPDGGVYKFVLTSPIDDAVYIDWAGASAGLVGRYVNIAEFENNGQTTAHITTIDVVEPAIPDPPIAEPPVEPDPAPAFNAQSTTYVKGSVVKYDGLYYILNYPQFSTPGTGTDGAIPGGAWADITGSVVAPYTAFLYWPTKTYKYADYVYYKPAEGAGHWYRFLNAEAGTGAVPTAVGQTDWTQVAYLGDGASFDEANYYTLGAENLADTIVRVDLGGDAPDYHYYRHSYFVGVENTTLIEPDSGMQMAWSPFTPYVKKKPIFASNFIPYIPPALPRSSYVAGKYWRFISNDVNSEVRPLPENLIEPKTYKTLSARVFNLDGSVYTASENDYLVLNTWSKV